MAGRVGHGAAANGAARLTGASPLSIGHALHGLSQRPDRALRRRRVDRHDLARIDDGAFRARSVLAGGRAPRNHGSPPRPGRDRERMLAVSHAHGACTGADAGQAAVGVRERHRRRAAARSPGGRRCLLHPLPSDDVGQAGPESELHGRLHHRRGDAPRAAPGCRPVRGGRGPGLAHALGLGVPPREGDAHPAIRGLRHVPHAVHAPARRDRQTDW